MRTTTPRLAHAAVLLACAGLATGARALTPAEFFARVSPSVWLVQTYEKSGAYIAQGSAVVIAPDTLITNCHVLSKAKSFDVIHDNLAYVGHLDKWDPARDICQITTAAHLNAPAVPLADTSQLVVGQPVYALGNPKGLDLTLSNGLLSALRRDEMRRLTSIQTNAPISHGSSGGGLFDADGRLIGITTFNVDDGQNLNFALPVDFIRELPARHLALLQGRPMPVSPVPPPSRSTPTGVPTRPTPVPVDPVPADTLPIPSAGAAPPVATPPRPLVPPPIPTPEPPPPAPARVAPRTVPAPAPAIVATALPPGTPRIPFLNDARQAEFRRYVGTEPSPKVCVISDNGHWACAHGNTAPNRFSSSDPKVRALKRCAELAGKACFVYQVDDRIVYQPPPSQDAEP
ncbi:S1C family serine protease [Scleromatobacter humisilvae]|uniref:S1C family serine protease n=1 Tax=Scleromatobacter humisilvae TaxID=2897159 RepID=A0A9X2BYQ7_9BURK|nr:S1C family serine protease [Scleromatobacter humisilvae]MCK9685592.1 S1C family serine protease [Scleromatobacter humisilvae]